jgi:hypothetical protein
MAKPAVDWHNNNSTGGTFVRAVAAKKESHRSHSQESHGKPLLFSVMAKLVDEWRGNIFRRGTLARIVAVRNFWTFKTFSKRNGS